MSNKVYKIGEIAEILQVKTSTLRFWESEFSQVQPKRTENGQRYYSSKDLDVLTQIHDLLHNQGLTIAGVKKTLKLKKEEQESSILQNPEITRELQNKINLMGFQLSSHQTNLKNLQKTITEQEQEITNLKNENEMLKKSKASFIQNQNIENKAQAEKSYICAELQEILTIIQSHKA